MIQQQDLDGATLAGRIEALLQDPDRLRGMADQARRFARPDAAQAIVDRVLELAGEG
jgi:UDP-N-acetylglucosamine:LPS N-acetylglucosamine transferase